MADTRGSLLPAMTIPVGSDIFIAVDDPAGTPATQKLTFANAWTNYFKGQADSVYSVLGHAHATTDITSGTFADARIAASNITQHQAALSITESQISDLGSYITASTIDTLTNKTIDTASNTLTIVEADISDLGDYLTPIAANLNSGSVSSSAGTLTLNYATQPLFNVTLTENVTVLAFTGWPAAGSEGKLRLRLMQDATGGRIMTFTGVIWPGGSAPTVTAAANAKDIYIFTTDDGGTTVYGHVVGQDFK